jgi:hypothetical protein
MILAAQWMRDPALTALFTPEHPSMGSYEVRTTTTALEVVVDEGGAAGVHFADLEVLNPLDAFGAAGTYNRAALARLYGGRRVHVVHGWAQRGDRFESVTLLSPYPDESLMRLHPGTMAITLTLERGGL